jgi:hypothetical protein
MEHLRNIFEKVLPKIMDQDPSFKQILFGEANCLDSHDLLHTSLSLAGVKFYCP